MCEIHFIGSNDASSMYNYLLYTVYVFKILKCIGKQVCPSDNNMNVASVIDGFCHHHQSVPKWSPLRLPHRVAYI